MKSLKRTIAVVALLAVTTGLAADSARNLVRTRCRPHPGVPRPCNLEGSWAVRVETDDDPMHAMYSFMPGGVGLASASPVLDPVLGNIAMASGHGAWKRGESGTFEFAFESLRYDARANLAGSIRSEAWVEFIDGYFWAGTMVFKSFDADGVYLDRSHHFDISGEWIPPHADQALPRRIQQRLR
jgi:hypothetical protein